MKTKTTKLQKLLAMFLAVAILLAAVPLSVAADSAVSPYEKKADAATLDGWKEFFGKTKPTTENAGGVWTDKSVFTDGDGLGDLVDHDGRPINLQVADDGFIVALSAIASNKQIVGYSYIPTDTVLVLDISGSMGPSTWQSRNNDAVSDLVLAANAAITELLALNNNNRVGVVLYSAEYDQGNDEHYYTLLPIDRYTATGTVTYNNGTRFDTSDDITVSEYLETNAGNQHNGNEISIASGVSGSNGRMRETTIDVVGGTYIQGGLKAAADMFKERSTANDTIIDGDGFQAGTQRKPVIVLMSDGAPTYATTSYKNVGDYTIGNGSTATSTNAFLTQLTAANIKNEITTAYNGSEALFYTLGLGVGGNTNAESVLDPANSTETINGYWNDFLAASNGATVTLTNWQEGNFSVVRDASVDSKEYANEYFEASSAADLFEAFNNIVNQIIIQSLYRPTLVEGNNAEMSGYIEFIDDIDDYMKVEQIEGIMIGDTLYTGEFLSRNITDSNDGLGTVEKPTDLGNEFIWAVQERLGIESVEQARELVSLAYGHGQLSYNATTGEYSNYIGWYADAQGKYIGFWDESHTYSQMPTDAVYCNKSYGMLGEIEDGYNESDLMYVSIQVHTSIAPMASVAGADQNSVIKAGHSQLIFRVPAALIPVVTYEVSLVGTGYEDATNITMEIKDAEPIRLLFEVGLRNDINEFNISAAAPENLITSGEDAGKYRFHTNDWSLEAFENKNSETSSEYAPSRAINTIAYFEPSYENERYYYNEPTPIYIEQGGEYVKYTSDTKPAADDSNRYYRQINVFELTGIGKDAQHKKVYERISNEALGRVDDVRRDDGGWNIKKETIRRVYDLIETEKRDKEITKTLEYSYYPTVEHIEGTHYYADAILGNNGVLTVTPATGIKISKAVDASLAGTDEIFTFNVSVEGASGNYPLVRESADGTLDRTPIITFTSGNATLTLKAGESAYIVDLPVDAEFTVAEDTSGKTYKVKSVNGNAAQTTATGEIEQFVLANAEFVNTLKEEGYLVISKEVTHPFANDPSELANKTFDFEVTLSNGGAAYPHNTVDAWYSTDINTPDSLDVTDNKISVSLKDDQALIIRIEEGWQADVVETNLPARFTPNNPAPASKEITAGSNVVYEFVNNYEPQAVSPDIELNFSKTLTGRPIKSGDSFTFKISRYNPATARYEALKDSAGNEVEETVVMNSSTQAFGSVLADALNRESFTKEGEYHYMVNEVVPTNTQGVTYDRPFRTFNILVSDDDMDGQLDYTVEAAELTSISTQSSADYAVTADFVNTYKAEGIAEIRIYIQKVVESTTGEDYSPEGFEFGIYDESGSLVGNTNFTDQNGKLVFTLAYTAEGVTHTTPKVYEYTLREIDDGIAGMNYAAEYPFTVTVEDNLDGTISAKTNITTTAPTGAPLINVTNHYSPDDAQAVIQGRKNFVDFAGEKLELEGEDFSFVLGEADENFDPLVAAGGLSVYTEKNDADGKFSYTLSFDEIGEYYYVLQESKGDDKHIEYDDTVYGVKITVSDNGSGALQSSVQYFLQGNAVQTVEFKNIYTPDPDAVSVDFNIEKSVKSIGEEEMGPEGFKFILSDKEGEIAELETDEHGKAKTTLSYTHEDKGKIFEYTIVEVDTEIENVTYSDAQYVITVEITLDKQSNTLVPVITVNNEAASEIVAEFENVYDYTPPTPPAEEPPAEEPPAEQPPVTTQTTSPKTGDTNPICWIAVLFVSGTGATLATKLRRKIRN